VIGLFIYAVVVAPMKGFSGWPGVLALALIVIPVVVRTTENMLQPDPQFAARGGLCAGRAEVEGDPVGHAEGRARGRGHRRAAGGGAHRRRDRAAALHRAVQPVLDHRPERADGQPAGDDLQVRDEPLRELAEAGLGRRLPDHAGVLALNIVARVLFRQKH
jgi:hypothetical protein